jgi:methionine sulfoxide reductase heme-binding subunit
LAIKFPFYFCSFGDHPTMTRILIAYIVPLSFAAMALLCFLLSGMEFSSVDVLLRYSARLSFLLFAVAFSTSGLHFILRKNWTRTLASYRREFGVAFALIHISHLALLVIKNHFFEPAFSESSFPSLIGGIIAYAFIAVMLLTSYTTFSSRISIDTWRRLHTAGGYVILITFTAAYARYTFETITFLPLLIIAISVWTIRIIKSFVKLPNTTSSRPAAMEAKH